MTLVHESRVMARLRSLRDFARKSEAQKKEAAVHASDLWLQGYDKGAAIAFEQIADELDELLQEVE